MKRGRPRKYNPAIPGHIDQRKLPAGVYWDKADRYWYTIDTHGARPHRRRLASKQATLADLHRLIEETRAPDDAGTVSALHVLFTSSEAWKRLAPATQRDYTACLGALSRLKTRAGPASTLVVDRISMQLAQRLVDAIAADRPAMANHVKRYMSRLIAWGMRRGHVRERANPFKGLEAAVEVRDHKMPERDVFVRTLAFARERGQRKPHTAGAVPEYLWIVMLLAYRLRMRGVEALDLNDSNKRPGGIYVFRRKGSRENITKWTPELEAAWAAAVMRRNRIWLKKRLPRPNKPELCPVIVNESGKRLTRSTLDSTWARFIKLAIREGHLTPETRYSLHGLKHRGITDTKGKRHKQDGAGHRDPAMTDHYDHEMLVVDATPGSLL